MMDIIKTADYVYSTFTKWGLKRYTCDIEYYTEEPLDDLSYVICSVLQAHNWMCEKQNMGLLLGFSLANVNSPKGHTVYYDAAEESLFEDLLKIVETEHLIKIEGNTIQLTALGNISAAKNTHYRFFKGNQGILEHLKLSTKSIEEKSYFPFYSDMGLYTEIEKVEQIWPDDEHIENIIESKNTPLIERIKLNSREFVHIYKASQQEYFDVESKSVEIKLYKIKSVYIPTVIGCNIIAEKATQLVNNGLNNTQKENLILECLFQKLWDDKSAILNSQTLNPYYELVDFEELTKDSRTQWTDSELVSIIFSHANPTCWKNITRYCDVEVLCKNLADISVYIDWSILSVRVSDQFLKDNFLTYPWDLGSIALDYNRNIKVIEQLILIPKKSEEEWNWEELEKRLSDEFVLAHLDIVDVDLAKFTQDTDEVQVLMLSYPEKRWDWRLVVSCFDLSFILQSIDVIQEYVCLNTLLDRVFTDSYWAIQFAESPIFNSILRNESLNNGVLSSCVLNDKDYIWCDIVIDCLTEANLLVWESTQYMQGFECNPRLKWDHELFDKYSTKVTSDAGHTSVSKQITTIDILRSYPNWPWDWTALSANISLLKDRSFYSLYGNRLNWSIVFDQFKDNEVLERIENIDTYLDDDAEAWKKFSAIASIEYVIEKYKESQYPWNWTVLTERMLPMLKLENLGNRLFVDKWDWNFLSKELPTDFITEHLSTYSSYWNWDIVFDHILTPANKTNSKVLDKIALALSYVKNENKAGAWTSLTSKYSFKELKKLILESARRKEYRWDMQVFCQHKEFDIFIDLEPYRNFIDWDTLSSSETVNKSFTYSPQSGIKFEVWLEDMKKMFADKRNHWNYKLLSHFSSLQSQQWFLNRYKDKIDWLIISKESKIFCKKNKQKLNETIEKYKSYINFKVLSERNDVNIRQITKIHPQGDYDYNALMRNNLIDVTVEMVDSMKDYPWDWYELSSQENIHLNAAFIQKHLDKPLNWEFLSSQNDKNIWGHAGFIKTISKDKEISNRLDWHIISSREYFPLIVLRDLPLDELDWKTLSARNDIFSYLLTFKDYLNWNVISKNIPAEKLNIEFLRMYKDKVDWYEICNNSSFRIDNTTLDLFADYIDWSAASASLNICFTKTLVERYKDKWNWPVLVKNKAFHNKINIADLPYGRQINVVEFIKHFPISPKAYHFTHMDNAIKIIRSMRLQSRNLASGNFSNSAGTNVLRTSKAHQFARFYFVPQSPTQFYNECLGKDSSDKYYLKALNLGLPKCPMPVFLIFDVEELLMAMPDKCYYSNGNMQKDASRSFKVIENPDMIKAKEIYTNSLSTKDERQQEFLIDGELDFSRLTKVKIRCYDEDQASMLRKELIGTKWEDKIKVDRSLYTYKNKELSFKDNGDTIRISSDYDLPYELRITYHRTPPEILNGSSVLRQRGNNIYMASSAEISKKSPFEVYFEVTTPRCGSWLIYKNY